MTYRMVTGADHGLSEPAWRQAYTALLVGWVGEMVLGRARRHDGSRLTAAVSGPAGRT